MNIFFVALGGAIGSVLRYLISILNLKISFPIITLFINIIGAIIIGFIVGIDFKKDINNNSILLFLKTGFCGGFTTFSTFSLETLQLIENKNYFLAGLYSLSSVIFCLIGVFLGRKTVNFI